MQRDNDQSFRTVHWQSKIKDALADQSKHASDIKNIKQTAKSSYVNMLSPQRRPNNKKRCC